MLRKRGCPSPSAVAASGRERTSRARRASHWQTASKFSPLSTTGSAEVEAMDISRCGCHCAVFVAVAIAAVVPVDAAVAADTTAAVAAVVTHTCVLFFCRWCSRCRRRRCPRSYPERIRLLKIRGQACLLRRWTILSAVSLTSVDHQWTESANREQGKIMVPLRDGEGWSEWRVGDLGCGRFGGAGPLIQAHQAARAPHLRLFWKRAGFPLNCMASKDP